MLTRAVRIALRAGALSAGLMAAGSVVAQTPQAPREGARLDEIVVTARKVEENLQQVPVAVTAITAEQIAQRGIEGLEDVARFTPGLSFENFTGPLAAPIIRGQTQTRVDLPVQNVASFFNGVYLQRNYMVDAALLDVERIEIIKGPQSALYGRNAFSGAINYITRTPGDAFEANVGLTVGSHDRREVRGSFSGPVTDWLGVLVAGGHAEFDGTWRNNHPLANQGTGTRDRVGGYDNQALLLGATIRPFQALQVDLAHSRSSLDVEHQPAWSVGTAGLLNAVNALNCSPGGTPTQNRLYCGELPVQPVLQPAELSGPFARPPGVVIDPRAYGQRGDSRLSSARAAWEIFDGFSLNYLFGYTDTDVTSRGSPARNPTIGTPLPVPPVQGLVGFDSQPNGAFTSRSHELRVEWQPGGVVRRAMVGGFVSRARDDISAWSRWGTPLSLAEPAFTFTFTNQTRRDAVESAFGLVTFDIGTRLSVTGELRWTEEELTLQARATSPGFIATPLDATAPIIRTQVNKFDYTTPRVAVDFRVTDDNFLYASAGKGVKSGGQNVPGNDPSQDTWEPEKNWTFEFGSKNDLFDDRLRLNLAVFYIDWEGIQGSVARNYLPTARPGCVTACTPPAPGTPVPVIVGNLGDAEVYGLEVDGAWLITDALTLNYGANWQRARYKDGQISQRAANAENCDGVVCALTVRNALGQPIAGAFIGGNQVERQPEYKAAIGLEYRFGTGAIDWRARTDATWQDKQYVDELNLAWVPSRTLVDASLSAAFGNFSARLWAKNLFDEEYVTTSLFLIGTDGARSASYVPLLGERRTFGLSVGWRY